MKIIGVAVKVWVFLSVALLASGLFYAIRAIIGSGSPLSAERIDIAFCLGAAGTLMLVALVVAALMLRGKLL